MLHAQDELEALVTWEVDGGNNFLCENFNKEGSDLNNDGYADLLNIWSLSDSLSYFGTIVTGDLDDDDDFEIVTGLDYSDVAIWDYDGTLVRKIPFRGINERFFIIESLMSVGGNQNIISMNDLDR
jgi:hypothetical protein